MTQRMEGLPTSTQTEESGWVAMTPRMEGLPTSTQTEESGWVAMTPRMEGLPTSTQTEESGWAATKQKKEDARMAAILYAQKRMIQLTYSITHTEEWMNYHLQLTNMNEWIYILYFHRMSMYIFIYQLVRRVEELSSSFSEEEVSILYSQIECRNLHFPLPTRSGGGGGISTLHPKDGRSNFNHQLKKRDGHLLLIMPNKENGWFSIPSILSSAIPQEGRDYQNPSLFL